MANTYTLIASNTLGSDAASVTFSSIPGTYTDLVLRASVRGTNSGSTLTRFQFNSDTASNYSYTMLRGDGTNVTSLNGSSTTNSIFYLNNAGATSSTFTNTEIYIPSYTASQNKPLSVSNVAENNATLVQFTEANAQLWRNTAAITSIYIYAGTGNLTSGSSFFLYGISKN